MALGRHLHFLLSRRVRGSPCTGPPHSAPAPGNTPGWQWWKWSSSCWQPPRATSATTDPGDNLHLNQAKVENRPRTQAQLPQGQQPPWLLGTTAPPAQHRLTRRGVPPEIVSAMTFSHFPSSPRGISHRLKHKKEKTFLLSEQAQANHNRAAKIREQNPGGGQLLSTICTSLN